MTVYCCVDADVQVPLSQLLVGAAEARAATFVVVGASTQPRATKTTCMRVLETARCHVVVAPRAEPPPAPVDTPDTPNARATADQPAVAGSGRAAAGTLRTRAYITA
jgi:hypothetical protein